MILFPADIQVPHPTMAGEFIGSDPTAIKAGARLKAAALVAEIKVKAAAKAKVCQKICMQRTTHTRTLARTAVARIYT